MSDPMTNVEIEDVLSSIRRLVSEDLRSVPRGEAPVAAVPIRPEAAPGMDAASKLVLTPAQRIDAGPSPEAGPGGDAAVPLPAATGPDMWRADAAADSGPAKQRIGRSVDLESAASLEATIAELESAVADIEDEFEPDLGPAAATLPSEAFVDDLTALSDDDAAGAVAIEAAGMADAGLQSPATDEAGRADGQWRDARVDDAGGDAEAGDDDLPAPLHASWVGAGMEDDLDAMSGEPDDGLVLDEPVAGAAMAVPPDPFRHPDTAMAPWLHRAGGVAVVPGDVTSDETAPFAAADADDGLFGDTDAVAAERAMAGEVLTDIAADDTGAWPSPFGGLPVAGGFISARRGVQRTVPAATPDAASPPAEVPSASPTGGPSDAPSAATDTDAPPRAAAADDAPTGSGNDDARRLRIIRAAPPAADGPHDARDAAGKPAPPGDDAFGPASDLADLVGESGADDPVDAVADRAEETAAGARAPDPDIVAGPGVDSVVHDNDPNADDADGDVQSMFDPADEMVIDADALRDLVVDIIRQELQGVLGERITRNVRKLVRREIHRALESRDLQ